MRITKAVFLLALCCAAASAERTKEEQVHPLPNPADDAKENSDKVPDVVAVSTKFERVVTLRFKYKTDLLAGLEKMVKQEKIKNAVILSAFGSVRNYHVHVVSNSMFPSKDVYIKDTNSPADVVGMSGYVMDGRVHPHIMLADSDRMFGGHLEPGTTAFTFVVVTLGVLEDKADLKRLDDKSYR